MNYYQPYYPRTDRIYVQGINAATSYPLAPNMTVTLWDSEKPIIYLKSADASGKPTMQILDYTIRETDTQTDDMSKLMQKIEQLEDKINSIGENNERTTANQE